MDHSLATSDKLKNIRQLFMFFRFLCTYHTNNMQPQLSSFSFSFSHFSLNTLYLKLMHATSTTFSSFPHFNITITLKLTPTFPLHSPIMSINTHYNFFFSINIKCIMILTSKGLNYFTSVAVTVTVVTSTYTCIFHRCCIV